MKTALDRAEACINACARLPGKSHFRQLVFSLYAFTQLLHEQLMRDGCRDVFLLSREGEFLKIDFRLLLVGQPLCRRGAHPHALPDRVEEGHIHPSLKPLEETVFEMDLAATHGSADGYIVKDGRAEALTYTDPEEKKIYEATIREILERIFESFQVLTRSLAFTDIVYADYQKQSRMIDERDETIRAQAAAIGELNALIDSSWLLRRKRNRGKKNTV